MRAPGGRTIEKTLFSFIWKYSKRQQLVLLAVTLCLFPLLYATLELPKRIINDAIGAGQSTVDVFSISFSQIGFLMLLCGAFLLAVLCHGLLKMRINTMKGVLAERLLRRFRYQLVTRLFRFPKPFFQRTSQAEIVSMVTAESEPLGGMMGDAISQPILQAGQMLTILAFLFLQSFWFGLAAIALIPLQAYIIPILQRRINKLNKQRIKEVRVLAAEIGETAAGSTDLRTSGGHPYRTAQLTHRLGRLFFIRLDIYRKKFFMKFLNNFITQLTPFFFFSIGGYLVIQGLVSIGALVAALAAYKDLSAPWKELLTYYNQFHEMAQRWQLITEHFAPPGVLNRDLVEGAPEEDVALEGEIVFEYVDARDSDGLPVVEGIDLTLPASGRIALLAQTEEERRAIAELLSREVVPTQGRILIGGRDLAGLHQATIGTRIGVAEAAPYLFAGTIGDNLMMSLRAAAAAVPEGGDAHAADRREAERSGNAIALPEDAWIDPEKLGHADMTALRTWWLSLEEGMGTDSSVIRRGLGLIADPDQMPELCAATVALRADIAVRLDGDGLAKSLRAFDPAEYHVALPLVQNILFAVPPVAVSQSELAAQAEFMPLLEELGLADDIQRVACEVTDLLLATFGADGTHHPLFKRLGIDAAEFEQTLKIRARVNGGAALKPDERALLLAMPCVLAPAQVLDFVGPELRDRIVAARPRAQGKLATLFEALAADAYVRGLTLLQNATFGILREDAGARGELVAGTVAAVLSEHGMRAEIATLTLGEQTLLGGSNLPAPMRERIGLMRAAIKRPDILILNQALASQDPEARAAAFAHLRRALPSTTLIQIEKELPVAQAQDFDMVVELKAGRIAQDSAPQSSAEETPAETAAPDLLGKLQAIKQTVFFSGVAQKQLRLLAFSAQSFHYDTGEMIFEIGDDPTDGVYLIQKGEADFFLPLEGGEEKLIRTAGPGSLVGELGLILGEPRTLSMRARSPVSGLRIGAEEFLSVVQNDAGTSFKFLQLIAGYVQNAPAKADD
ncbi:MAG: cyclic nucleotide-binding domain-containing protein [Pseudomonadota bacterium]